MLVLSTSRNLSTQFCTTEFYLSYYELMLVAGFFLKLYMFYKSKQKSNKAFSVLRRGTPKLYFEPVTVQPI